MKKNKKLLKILGGALGVGALLCIIPACVVSCGSSSNSSSSSTSSSSTTSSSTTNNTTASTSSSTTSSKTTTSTPKTTAPSLPTSLTGSSMNDVNTDWTNAFTKYATTTDYANWMQANLQNYANEAPTYFSDLATAYAKQTGISTTIKGETATTSIPEEDVPSSNPTGTSSGTSSDSPLSGDLTPAEKQALQNAENDVAGGESTMITTSDSTPATTQTPTTTSSQGSTTNSTNPDESIPTSDIPNITTGSSKSYDVTGYLPFTINITLNMGSSTSSISNLSTMDNNMVMTIWLKLVSDKLSNWTVNDNKFSFDIDQSYDSYIDLNGAITSDTINLTETIKDATFASTLLAPLTDTLNSNKDTTVDAGWYMTSCTSNTYTSSDLSSIINKFKNASDSASSSPLSSIPDSIKNLIPSTDSLVTTSTTTTPTSMSGGTSFSNPSTSTWINAPLTSDFYYEFSNFLANDFETATNANKDIKASYNTQDLTGNEWLKSFAQAGLAGYALNSSKQIASTSQISNPNSSLLDSLKTQVQFSVTETISISIPMPTGTTGTNGMPEGTTSGTTENPYSTGGTGSTDSEGMPAGIIPTGTTGNTSTTGTQPNTSSSNSTASTSSSPTTSQQTGSTTSSSTTNTTPATSTNSTTNKTTPNSTQSTSQTTSSSKPSDTDSNK